MSASGDYISREAALALAESEEYLTPDGDEIYHEYIPVSAVKRIPAADVRPVRRGKWLPIIEGNEYGETYQAGCYCSECNEGLQHEPNFCPNCGADMREES